MTNPKNQELLPCPFPQCGSNRIIRPIEQFDISQNEAFFTAVCLDCGAAGPTEGTREGAIAAWNTRADGWQPIESMPLGVDVIVWHGKHKHARLEYTEKESVKCTIISLGYTKWMKSPTPPKVDD